MTDSGYWKTIWEGETEPYEAGGISWGGYTIIQQYNSPRRRRASKGWRKHVRKTKQENKRG